jgi:copper(I)-binding protein
MTRFLALTAVLLLFSCSKPTPAAIEANDAWARATAEGQSGAVYVILANKGGADDRLVSASTPRASMAMIHRNDESGGMARMRSVEALDVPAGERIDLKPGGTHVMLMGLDEPLRAGEHFDLKLKFEHSGEKTVSVAVVAAGGQ